MSIQPSVFDKRANETHEEYMERLGFKIDDNKHRRISPLDIMIMQEEFMEGKAERILKLGPASEETLNHIKWNIWDNEKKCFHVVDDEEHITDKSLVEIIFAKEISEGKAEKILKLGSDTKKE